MLREWMTRYDDILEQVSNVGGNSIFVTLNVREANSLGVVIRDGREMVCDAGSQNIAGVLQVLGAMFDPGISTMYLGILVT